LHYDIIPLEKVVIILNGEVELMTDEQFETYNKLLELVDKLIEELPNEKQKDYKQKKNDILLKK